MPKTILRHIDRSIFTSIRILRVALLSVPMSKTRWKMIHRGTTTRTIAFQLHQKHIAFVPIILVNIVYIYDTFFNTHITDETMYFIFTQRLSWMESITIPALRSTGFQHLYHAFLMSGGLRDTMYLGGELHVIEEWMIMTMSNTT